jgi:hypothetical protein
VTALQWTTKWIFKWKMMYHCHLILSCTGSSYCRRHTMSSVLVWRVSHYCCSLGRAVLLAWCCNISTQDAIQSIRSCTF